jgi:hypothetical protein
VRVAVGLSSGRARSLRVVIGWVLKASGRQLDGIGGPRSSSDRYRSLRAGVGRVSEPPGVSELSGLQRVGFGALGSVSGRYRSPLKSIEPVLEPSG